MISMEDWVTIRNLKSKNPKLSNREIGRLLGISHNTVKSAIEKENLPQYSRKAKPSEKLQSFEEIIFEMVNVRRYKVYFLCHLFLNRQKPCNENVAILLYMLLPRGL